MSDSFLDTTPLDARAKPLIDALTIEYDTRYYDFRAKGVTASQELARYPAELFAPPHGAFVLLIRDGQTIGGGAFKRYDERTAELKRVWTHADFRRQGLARRVLEQLEARAIRQGYSRVYLTTGFRQPEAWGLYTDSGYTPLFDTSLDPQVILHLPFGKDLIEPSRTSSLDDLRAAELAIPAEWRK
jgi:GNAT superfamily N-acetyltransferase